MRGLWLTLCLMAGVAVAGERVSLDEATAAQLASLPGVDEGLAERIVALRAARGGLTSVEELRVVPGISEAAIDALRAGTVLRIAVTTTERKVYSSAEEVLAAFDAEPTVQQMHDWANEYAQVQPELVARWLRASRAFGGLPQLRVAYGFGDDYGEDYRYYDENGNPPTSADAASDAVRTDADRSGGHDLSVWATWDLDKLVMSSEQIRVINEAQDIAKLREKVLGEVTRLYFDRRRLQVDMLLNPKSDLMGQVKDELRLREITASLDAYTGGRMSEALAALRGKQP
jgi:hypothetical protein